MDLTNLLNNIPYSSKNAIVFDIDGTLINNNKKLNTKTFEFYYYCLYKKYKIYIITSRQGTDRNVDYTVTELDELGIENYDKIFFTNPKNNIQNLQDAMKYKQYVRKYIQDLGYNITLSIGDQDSDYGKYGGIGIKVINNGEKFVRMV